MLRSREWDERGLKRIVQCQGLADLCGCPSGGECDLADVTGLHNRETPRVKPFMDPYRSGSDPGSELTAMTPNASLHGTRRRGASLSLVVRPHIGGAT